MKCSTLGRVDNADILSYYKINSANNNNNNNNNKNNNPSGLRASHVKEAVFCPSPNLASTAAGALHSFVSILAGGDIPSCVVPHLCGASLLAVNKRGGGYHSIAVGEVLLRLVSKCLAQVVRLDVANALPPSQLGVGVSLGCEAIVHSVNRVLENPSIPDSGKWTLLVDFSNAFNCIDRSAMFHEVRSRLPALSPWIECCYGCQPLLHFGSHCLLSCIGVQQGDPLGPLSFALTLQPIVEQIKQEVPNLLINSWYLDDGTLCGSPDDLLAALNIIEREGPSFGLHLNRSKSLLFIPPSCSGSMPSNPLPPDLPTTSEGFLLLGCPVGSPAFCASSASDRVEKIRSLIHLLPSLEDAHTESTLLRSCLSLPKLAFLLRTCPPSFIMDALHSFDESIYDSLSNLVGGSLSTWSWDKASLPVALSGLGLRRASLHAPAAFIASSFQFESLISDILGFDPSASVHLPAALQSLALSANRPDWSSSLDSIDIPRTQRHLSGEIDLASQQKICDSTPGPDLCFKALCVSTSLPHSGDWPILGIRPSSPGLGIPLVSSVLARGSYG